MQYYELATLTLPFGTAGKAGEGLAAFTADPAAKGRLLGAFTTDIGTLNRLIVLRGFADAADLLVERRRTLESASPFGCGAFLTEMALDSYAPFPFLPPVDTATRGPVYEIRTYRMKTGGLPHTIAAWERALPERSAFSPCRAAKYPPQPGASSSQRSSAARRSLRMVIYRSPCHIVVEYSSRFWLGRPRPWVIQAPVIAAVAPSQTSP